MQIICLSSDRQCGHFMDVKMCSSLSTHRVHSQLKYQVSRSNFCLCCFDLKTFSFKFSKNNLQNQFNIWIKGLRTIVEIYTGVQRTQRGFETITNINSVGGTRMVIRAEVQIQSFANFSQIMFVGNGVTVDKIPAMQFKNCVFIDQILRTVKWTQFFVNSWRISLTLLHSESYFQIWPSHGRLCGFPRHEPKFPWLFVWSFDQNKNLDLWHLFFQKYLCIWSLFVLII